MFYSYEEPSIFGEGIDLFNVGLTQKGDKSPDYKQIFWKYACLSKGVQFVVAQFIAPCVSRVNIA